MADRIAVMDAGHIDQLAAPSEIYDRPATPFVADFIGEMNHLEGTLERDGDQLVGVVGSRPLRHRPRDPRGAGRRARAARRAAGGDPRTTDGEGVPADCQTAMVLGHDVQVVAKLETGDEVVAVQRRSSEGTASTPATRCGSDGARRQRCYSAPRTTARACRAGGATRNAGLTPKGHDEMADRPDELNILVPNERVAEVRRMVTRRQALYAGGAAAMAAYVAGCGGSTGGGKPAAPAGRRRGRGGLGREAADPGRRQGRGRRPAAGQLGRLLRPGELQGLREGVRPHGQGLGLRLQRRDPRQAAGRRLEVRRDLPDRLRRQDDGRPRADHAAHARADPEHVEHLPAFTQTDYDPGNKFSVPKDYGITSFYWLTDKVSDKPTTIAEASSCSRTRR